MSLGFFFLVVLLPVIIGIILIFSGKGSDRDRLD